MLFFFFILYIILFTLLIIINIYKKEGFENNSISKQALENPIVFLPSNHSFKQIDENTINKDANEIPDQYPDKLIPIISKNQLIFDITEIPEPLLSGFKEFKKNNKQLNEKDDVLFNRFMIPFLWQTCINLINVFQTMNKDLIENKELLKNTIPQIQQLNKAIQNKKNK